MPKRWARRRKDGSLVIPATVCDELGLGPDESALVEVVDGELRIQPANRVVEQAQAVFRHHVPRGVSLADELIADRRGEAETE